MAREGGITVLAGKKLSIPSLPANIIRLPRISSTKFSFFVYTIASQSLVYCMAVRKGIDIGQTRHLAKSVTRE
jgi:glucosamine 6-phosphate synthetase-like amidotransferase/phosphosugar isomerase protein